MNAQMYYQCIVVIAFIMIFVLCLPLMLMIWLHVFVCVRFCVRFCEVQLSLFVRHHVEFVHCFAYRVDYTVTHYKRHKI